MVFLLDIGNSRIKWGCLEQGELTHIGAVSHNDPHDSSDAGYLWKVLPRPDRIVAASVVGQSFNEALTDSVKKLWGRGIEFIVSERNAFGVINAYDNPKRLGVDRWAALIGVHQLVHDAAYIVDCGTALTIDVITSEGQHLGGLIAPGLMLQQQVLMERIQWSEVESDTTYKQNPILLANDTENAVVGGSLYSSIAMIDRIYMDITKTMGVNISRIITGGSAPVILPLLQEKYLHKPHLVLKGLSVLAEH